MNLTPDKSLQPVRVPGAISTWAVCVALTFSLIGFVVGSGPFPPGLLLLVIAIPVAAVTAFLGPWRLSVAAIYFGVAALCAIPLSKVTSLDVDGALTVLGAAGVVLSGLLYLDHARKAPRRLDGTDVELE